jgi:hypothetical protein
MSKTQGKRYNKKNNTRKNKKVTLKGGKKHQKSLEYKKTSSKKYAFIIEYFLEMLNMVKLYHWKTTSYAQHKATDHLYAELNENIDQFVEVLLGKDERRIEMVGKKIRLIDPSDMKEFKEQILKFRGFLNDMDKVFKKKSDSDILSIRDDLLVEINQFIYLLSLD